MDSKLESRSIYNFFLLDKTGNNDYDNYGLQLCWIGHQLWRTGHRIRTASRFSWNQSALWGSCHNVMTLNLCRASCGSCRAANDKWQMKWLLIIIERLAGENVFIFQLATKRRSLLQQNESCCNNDRRFWIWNAFETNNNFYNLEQWFNFWTFNYIWHL